MFKQRGVQLIGKIVNIVGKLAGGLSKAEKVISKQ